MFSEKKHLNRIVNPSGFKAISFISMIYVSIMICNSVLTNRYVGNDSFFILGGTLTSPFIFILDDIVAEIYGYKMARSMIVFGFVSQTIFSLICLSIVSAPHPSNLAHKAAFDYILGASLLKIDLSGFFAYILANLLNSYIISRWKVLLKGKKFWMRSVGSSAVSEMVYSVIAIILMEFKKIPGSDLIKIISISYLIKVAYSTIFSGPANLLVNFLKKKTGIDVYDLPRKYTPFYNKGEQNGF